MSSEILRAPKADGPAREWRCRSALRCLAPEPGVAGVGVLRARHESGVFLQRCRGRRLRRRVGRRSAGQRLQLFGDVLPVLGEVSARERLDVAAELFAQPDEGREVLELGAGLDGVLPQLEAALGGADNRHAGAEGAPDPLQRSLVAWADPALPEHDADEVDALGLTRDAEVVDVLDVTGIAGGQRLVHPLTRRERLAPVEEPRHHRQPLPGHHAGGRGVADGALQGKHRRGRQGLGGQRSRWTRRGLRATASYAGVWRRRACRRGLLSGSRCRTVLRHRATVAAVTGGLTLPASSGNRSGAVVDGLERLARTERVCSRMAQWAFVVSGRAQDQSMKGEHARLQDAAGPMRQDHGREQEAMSNRDAGTSGAHPTERSVAFCPQCGTRAIENCRFCASCGRELLAVGSMSVSTEPAESPVSSDPAVEPVDLVPVQARRLPAVTPKHAVVGTISAGCVALLILLIIVGVGHFNRRDVRAALSVGANGYDAVVAGLQGAKTPEDLEVVAGTATDAKRAVEQQARAMDGRGDDLGRVVAEQLRAQASVLGAVEGLRGFAGRPLSTYAVTHLNLTTALARERGTRDALARHDSSAAGRLPSDTVFVTALSASAAPTLRQDATTQSSSMLSRLRDAQKSVTVRNLSAEAATQATAIAGAVTSMTDGPEKAALAAVQTAFAALGRLGSWNGENPEVWTGLRTEMLASFGSVADLGADPVAAGELRTVLRDSADSTDRLVASVKTALDDWHAQHAAAVEERRTDAEALKQYAGMVRAQMQTYDQLRGDMARFTARVRDTTVTVTYPEAYGFMARAGSDRRDVRDTLNYTAVPDGMGGAHEDLVGVVDRAISAVQAAYDGIAQSQNCYYGCPYYRDTPGWQEFMSESDAITGAFSGALSRWEAEVVAQTTAVDTRTLPARPDV